MQRAKGSFVMFQVTDQNNKQITKLANGSIGIAMGTATGNRGWQCHSHSGASADESSKKPNELFHHAAGYSSAWPRLPIKNVCNSCATDAPPIKCSGVVHPTRMLANRHLVKLGLIKSERKKTLSIIDHAATLQEIRRPKKEACAS
ncbi:hypothetical protein EVAR_5761_1 [Eumeta japonica]|uniref:Uncharacterized protein n=1 Tax=Eumeta variegata TaxID=151549 RepID=A0A4C1T777_EUMVA|nr:hypothetical protein EVAR_5761_1 [Eumeta japonica]